MNNIKKIILHHSATDRDAKGSTAEAFNAYHKSKGWGSIGYHFVIEKDKIVDCSIYGRKETDCGAHTIGQNCSSLGICIAGWYDDGHDNLPNNFQLNSLRDLLLKKLKQYNLKKEDIKFHRDYANKSCPGFHITKDFIYKLIEENNMACEAELKQIEELKARILERDATVSDLRKKVNDRNEKIERLEKELKLATQLVEQKDKEVAEGTKKQALIERIIGSIKELLGI